MHMQLAVGLAGHCFLVALLGSFRQWKGCVCAEWAMHVRRHCLRYSRTQADTARQPCLVAIFLAHRKPFSATGMAAAVLTRLKKGCLMLDWTLGASDGPRDAAQA